MFLLEKVCSPQKPTSGSFFVVYDVPVFFFGGDDEFFVGKKKKPCVQKNRQETFMAEYLQVGDSFQTLNRKGDAMQ